MASDNVSSNIQFVPVDLPTITGVDSESLDPDDVGDIADEGAGHRG